MTPRRLLYLWHQWRHAHAKREKDPTFRVRPAIDIIKRHAGNGWMRVLDLGPRSEKEMVLLELAGWQVRALDLFPTCKRIRRGDIHALPYANKKFDLVFASHVLEHSFDIRQVAKEIVRVLRSPGYLWSATPRNFVPTGHDRFCFNHPKDLLQHFEAAGATIHVLFEEIRPTEMRLLVEVRK